MRPDATKHDPRPEYLRALIDSAGLSQREAARRIGISERVMRYYVADGTDRLAPYPVQFALESLAGPTPPRS
jgi:transcriptional regulator with XRE-family HTH domain